MDVERERKVDDTKLISDIHWPVIDGGRNNTRFVV